jgi:serine protease inhibitor
MVYLPYQGGQLGMHIILPNEKIGMADFLQNFMTQNNFMDWNSKLVQYELQELTIPKFKFEFFNPLKDILVKMGVKLAFTGAADFSGITNKE